MSASDTIVAIATAAQNAGVGVIRLSGPASLDLLQKLFVKPSGHPFSHFKPRCLQFGKIVSRDRHVLDEALAVWMPAPNTLTGEDVVEFQCHGNLHLLRRVLREILSWAESWPIRAAGPGEFSKRAFLNGKMDLTQVEAVHDLIQAQSEAALSANLANLDGALTRRIDTIRDKLILSLALVEASFEFPDEDIQTYDPGSVCKLLQEIHIELGELLSAYSSSKLMDEGVHVAIVGRPNVGKSSLLNAILREDRAIVADIAGTTRDLVQASKMIAGLRFHFSDTAGLRETDDFVELQGIARSHAAAQRADIVLHVTDDPNDLAREKFGQKTLYILNKEDLYSPEVIVNARNHFDFIICTENPHSIERLESLLVEALSVKNVQNSVHVNERQYQSLFQAQAAVHKICTDWDSHTETEILAEELRYLISCLDEVTGKITSEDILGEIFKRFCIGK